MTIFENLLGAVQVGGALLLSPILHRRYSRWGATEAETRQPLPGDDLVPEPQMMYTRALTIQAAPEQVWPWLAQIGQGRGGLYSYDGLENLVGCNIHSAAQILPEFQNPQVGELIRLGPQGYPSFAVHAVEAPTALVLISANPQTGLAVEWQAQPDKGYSISTWQFVLQPQENNTTRLLVRGRLAYSRDLTWVWRLTNPVGFVMERKMMLGIRQRAERT